MVKLRKRLLCVLHGTCRLCSLMLYIMVLAMQSRLKRLIEDYFMQRLRVPLSA